MAKEWAKAFYHSTPWLTVREEILKRDRHTCVRCHCPGNQVHHIIHLTPENINDPRIALNPRNLEVLCDDCHKAEHKDERMSSCNLLPETRKKKELIKPDYEFDEQGNLIAPRGT